MEKKTVHTSHMLNLIKVQTI